MAKPNAHRKRFYDAYKNEGRREKNKARKAAKAEKRSAYFEKRREAALPRSSVKSIRRIRIIGRNSRIPSGRITVA